MSGDLTAPHRARKREQYKQWINRSVGFGVVSCLIAVVVWVFVGEPLVLFAGIGLYWLGCLGMALGYWFSPVSVHDELERRMEREASQTTLILVSAVVYIGFPAEIAFIATGVYTLPAAIRGAIWTLSVVVGIWILAHWTAKRQYA